jgi:NADPH:quinone reductase-like Zn-dependent oxidoreductase
VQLAKQLGASVTAVTSAANAALVTELGADHVIDYRERPPSAIEDRFDVVFDTVGTLSIGSGRRLLGDGGRLILAVAGLGDTVRAGGNVLAGSAPERTDDIGYLLGLVASGELRVVVDRQITLDRIADGHRRVDSGRKVGNLVVVADGAADAG